MSTPRRRFDRIGNRRRDYNALHLFSFYRLIYAVFLTLNLRLFSNRSTISSRLSPRLHSSDIRFSLILNRGSRKLWIFCVNRAHFSKLNTYFRGNFKNQFMYYCSYAENVLKIWFSDYNGCYSWFIRSSLERLNFPGLKSSLYSNQECNLSPFFRRIGLEVAGCNNNTNLHIYNINITKPISINYEIIFIYPWPWKESDQLVHQVS